MTPKEKAMQLFNKMIVDFKIDKWQTQQCALIAVNEILDVLYYEHKDPDKSDYWQKVKQELEKL